MRPVGDVSGLRAAYLETVKRGLLDDLSAVPTLAPLKQPESKIKLLVYRALQRRGLVPAYKENRDERLEGAVWPYRAVTMIGRARLENIERCLEDVLARGVPGDCIETGVWRGGGSIYMRAVLNAYGATDRRVWAADSFEGLPAPNPRYPADQSSTFHESPQLAVSLEEVRANFERFGLLDESVVFLKGWFSETLPSTHDQTWSLVRLDGDMYESTMDALTHLYPNLSTGGWLIVDDYKFVDSARQAVDDYRARNGITEPIVDVDFQAVCWKRQAR
jgi:O-methyltransferase